MDLGYRPLVYMWVAEFDDGTAVPQFDPETGLENIAHPDWLPSEIDDEGCVIKDGVRMPYRVAYPIPDVYKGKRIVRFGWYPFSRKMADKILRATGKIVVPSHNRLHIVELKNGEEVIAFRTNLVHYAFFGGEVKGRETRYKLGKADGKVMTILEDGSLG